jgi:hypothetical protein
MRGRYSDYDVVEVLSNKEKEGFKALLIHVVSLRAQVPVYIHTTYPRSAYCSTTNTLTVTSSEMLAIFTRIHDVIVRSLLKLIEV